FNEPNATYDYALATTDKNLTSPGGNFTVRGTALSVNVTFAPPIYPVTFSETGLATGTGWSVTLGARTHSSTTSTIAFNESNGTYAFRVGSLAGYTVSPSSGNVTVHGAAVTEAIAFTVVVGPEYSVTFAEVGMPPVAGGGVAFNGGALTPFGGGGRVTFTEPNGSYPYTIAAASGYLLV
ncbi:thermopsin precursor, partial [mine drainage metagenome]